MFRLATTDVHYDSRANREAGTLAEEHDVFILDLLLDNGERKEIINGFQVERIRLWTKKLPKNVFFWAIKYIEYLIKVVARAVSKRADVYHAYNLDTLIPAYISAKLRRAKVVYYARELSTEIAGEQTPLRSFWRCVERMLIRRVDRVVAANEARAKIMQDEYGIERTPEVILSCPYLIEPHPVGKLRAAVRDKIGEPGKIVIYQGALLRDRCLEQVVMSVKYLDDDIVVVFLGYGELKDSLRALAKEDRVNDRVFFHDAVPSKELLSYTASADLGIVIYKNTNRNNYYCAPNKLFEYIMSGIPVVGSDFPGITPIVRGYDIGMVFDPENERSISEAIRGVLNDKETYERMKKNTARAREVFNWNVQKEKLLVMYNELLPREQEQHKDGRSAIY